MRIPDCRTDENYNEKYLRGRDKHVIEGYDYLVENAIESFFFNLDMYEGLDDIFSDNKAVVMKGKADLVKEALLDWIESGRDELICAMIDDMDDAEYAKAKEEEMAKEKENDEVQKEADSSGSL